MPFAKKEKESNSAASGNDASKLNLTAAFDDLNVMLQSVITETQAIPDSYLTPDPQLFGGADAREALKEVAALIGFNDYDPEKISTLYMLVKDDGGKNLYGPSLKAYGSGVAVIWGQKVIPLDNSESFGSDKFSIMVGEYGASLLVDPSGYCMPITVGLDAEYAKADSYKTFKTKLMTLRTAGAIAPYLKRGEPMLKWGDVKDGETVSFYEVTAVNDKDDPSKVKYYKALAEYNGAPFSMYCPGDAAQWTGVVIGDEPIVLTKVSGSSITSADGKVYEIKGSFTKLSELEVGSEYKVTGFTAKDGKYGREVLLDVISPKGEALKVNGNTLIVQRLGNAPSSEITPDNPAKLFIDSIGVTKSGKARVICRLVTSGDEESPMIKQLRQRQAELAAQKETALAGTIPF
jgi:hypothetical protein